MLNMVSFCHFLLHFPSPLMASSLFPLPPVWVDYGCSPLGVSPPQCGSPTAVVPQQSLLWQGEHPSESVSPAMGPAISPHLFPPMSPPHSCCSSSLNMSGSGPWGSLMACSHWHRSCLGPFTSGTWGSWPPTQDTCPNPARCAPCGTGPEQHTE